MLEEARSNRQPLDPTLLAEAFYKVRGSGRGPLEEWWGSEGEWIGGPREEMAPVGN